MPASTWIGKMARHLKKLHQIIHMKDIKEMKYNKLYKCITIRYKFNIFTI